MATATLRAFRSVLGFELELETEAIPSHSGEQKTRDKFIEEEAGERELRSLEILNRVVTKMPRLW